jgi:hypothetical protein
MIKVQGQPGKKVHETPSQPIKARCGGANCHPSYVGSAGWIEVHTGLVINVETLLGK